MVQDAISMGEPLASGRTADIYAWEDGCVLKLFHEWFPREEIEYEAHVARAVHASGLPVPSVGNIVRVGERNGLIYERVYGPSMLEVLQRKPWRLFRYARRLSALQARMHSSVFKAEVPAQPDKLEHKIRHAAALPAHLRTLVLAGLAAMPEDNRICHGDFHPGNVLLTTQGMVIIDWIDATCGNPLADVARTTVILLGAVENNQLASALMGVFVRLRHRAYLRSYFSLRPGGEDEYRRWLPIVAAARLSEGMPKLESWLIAQAHEVEQTTPTGVL